MKRSAMTTENSSLHTQHRSKHSTINIGERKKRAKNPRNDWETGRSRLHFQIDETLLLLRRNSENPAAKLFRLDLEAREKKERVSNYSILRFPYGGIVKKVHSPLTHTDIKNKYILNFKEINSIYPF